MNKKEKNPDFELLRKQQDIIDVFMTDLHGVIDKAREAMKKGRKKAEQLQSDLAALAKPELRHFDYGHHPECKTGSDWVKIKDKFYWLGDGEYFSESGHDDAWFAKGYVGNWLADLALLAEPLKEFEVDNKDHDRTITVTLIGSNRIQFWTKETATGREMLATLKVPAYAEFCRKANQVLATAKLKAAKT
jgi:hypothetical protein